MSSIKTPDGNGVRQWRWPKNARLYLTWRWDTWLLLPLVVVTHYGQRKITTSRISIVVRWFFITVEFVMDRSQHE